MAASDKELELQLMEAGNKLVEPPSSVDDLIILLDQVENCLIRVEQSPSQSMQNALSPSLKALVTERLFRHTDDDVKVAVASCISEITRITAPDAPYDDDQMKEVFQLIVSSFENLSDKSSRSFSKRTSILETVAKVRSCVVMLDLECDALIVEMFQHFLKVIRDYHGEAVFTSMVTIMTLVLEESEEIPTELLSPILASLKKDNEEVLLVARRLAEKVLESCASKLKPYLSQAVGKLGIPLDDYSSVVSSICQETPVAVEQNDAPTEKHVDERKPAEAPLNEEAQEDKEISKEAAATEQVAVANDKSPKAIISNGNVQTTISPADSNSLKNQEDESPDKSKIADVSSAAEPDKFEAANSESKSEQSAEGKGKKSDSKSTEPYDNSHLEEKGPETLTDQKNDVKDDAGISRENQSVDGAVSLENKIEMDVKPSSPKATENESTNVVSPTPSVTIPEESRSKRTSRPKKKESSNKEATPVDDVSKKISEGTSDSDSNATKKISEGKSDSEANSTKKISEGKSDSEANATKKISEGISDSEANANKKISEGASDSEANANKKISEGTSDSEAKANKKISEGTSDSEAKANKKISEGTSDSDPKVNICSGKKAATVVVNEDNDLADVDATKTESGIASDSEAKPLRQSSKKVDAIRNNADGSSSKQLEDKKKRARGKIVTEKDGTKSATKNNDEETPASAKLKPNKGESCLEETPKTNSKRKHTPSKQKASGSVEYGENLVGSKVKVYWPKDRAYYDGVIESFDSVKKKHKVHYNDGDEEILNLKRERWEFIEDESGVDEDAGHSGPDDSSEMPQKKKAKTADPPSKKSKLDASPKRGGGASSGKSKGAASKSARKTKEDSKVDGKSKDGSKSSSKSENENVSKVKDPTPKSGSKSVEVAVKIGNKSKNEESGETPKSSKSRDDDSLTLKASLKLKQDTSKTPKSKPETPKSSSNSKGKLLKSGGKSNANGIGKSKVKDSEMMKENSIDSAKVSEGGKRKSPSSGKGQGSDSRSGKKRRR